MKLLWILPLLIGCGGADNLQIKTYTIQGGEITIRASEQFAGAIDSVKWNGKEFIDNTDHGRELQSASSFNAFGECYNPTEGGSRRDGYKATSSSILNSVSAEGDTLKTETQMAFWLAPGESSDCGVAKNIQVVSDHILSKTVKTGHLVSDHIIEYQVIFSVPRSYNTGKFEVLTGYMPEGFNKFHRYDPSRSILLPDTNPALPLIYTDTENYAMGIYTPDPLTYGSFTSEELEARVVKWNTAIRIDKVAAGEYGFRCYVIVGTLDDVMVSMTQLYNYFS